MLACALTRLPFVSGLLYNMDSVQFALALDRFDVGLHQPQPPGYFLYVMMGRLARLFVHDDNTALIAIGILFACLTSVMVYRLASEMFGRETGIAAAWISVSSPLLWFHAEVALSYMPEAFMSLLVAWLCYRTLAGESGMAVAAAVSLGLAGGIRQNTLVFLMPLWLYSMKGAGLKKASVSAAAFALTVAAWAVPMLYATGGISRYYSALQAHWLDANWHGIHIDRIAANGGYMAYFILCGLGLALVPILFAAYSRQRVALSQCGVNTGAFLAFWLAPAICFHLLVFTHPAVPGHSLIYVVGLIVLAGYALVAASEIIASASSHDVRTVRHSMLALVAAANSALFLLSPYPISAHGINAHDRELAGYIRAVRDNFQPADTEIIGDNRFLFSYRHAMYYLPEYTVHNTWSMSVPNGKVYLSGHDRVTSCSDCIRFAPGTKRVVEFSNYGPEYLPLPADALTLPAGGDKLLVYYDDVGAFQSQHRISGIMCGGG